MERQKKGILEQAMCCWRKVFWQKKIPQSILAEINKIYVEETNYI